VGEDVGFVSPAHFSHVFRKMTGLTPTEYRQASAATDDR
jgi:AraC-like DNA-binding protein